jgi:hypothetical protein
VRPFSRDAEGARTAGVRDWAHPGRRGQPRPRAAGAFARGAGPGPGRHLPTMPCGCPAGSAPYPVWALPRPHRCGGPPRSPRSHRCHPTLPGALNPSPSPPGGLPGERLRFLQHRDPAHPASPAARQAAGATALAPARPPARPATGAVEAVASRGHLCCSSEGGVPRCRPLPFPPPNLLVPLFPQPPVSHTQTPISLTPPRTAPHRTAPHRTAPHRTAPHRTAPHRTV